MHEPGQDARRTKVVLLINRWREWNAKCIAVRPTQYRIVLDEQENVQCEAQQAPAVGTLLK